MNPAIALAKILKLLRLQWLTHRYHQHPQTNLYLHMRPPEEGGGEQKAGYSSVPLLGYLHFSYSSFLAYAFTGGARLPWSDLGPQA